MQFLAQVQRLLAEGAFVSSYKFALLLALADLAVEHGDDSGAPLPLSLRAIADKVVACYWRQTLPYANVASGQSGLLLQSTGAQAALLNKIHATQEVLGASLGKARLSPYWNKLVTEAAKIIEEMPLWRLQTVGSAKVPFLYDEQLVQGAILLKPGVAFCFRRFHGLIEDMVQGAWVRFLRRLSSNQALLGQAVDLQEFLFGSERADLSVFRPVLAELQEDRCFYCDRALQGPGQVDHFIPWARYPVDLGHNFVLAHGSCNNAKSDRLAALEHLHRWCERNDQHGQALAVAFDRKGVVHDLVTSRKITRWAYTQNEAASGLVWLKKDDLIPLPASWHLLPGLVA